MENQSSTETSTTSPNADQPRSRAPKSASSKNSAPTVMGMFRIQESDVREVLYWHRVMFGASSLNSEGGSDA
jgi:hypothetical protein